MLATLKLKSRIVPNYLPCSVISAVSITNFKPVTEYPKIEFPERRKLRMLEKVPQSFIGNRPQKMMKRLIDMRGPELYHTTLIHKQYGIRAILGGKLRHGHFEMIRNGIGRHMDDSRMFARWRVDAPWKSVTKKGQGHRMGGGKGSVDHYVTPVRSGRIIVEMGGYCEYEEVEPFLRRIAEKMPFKAEVISQEMLDNEKANETKLKEENLNPLNFEYCVTNNFLGCRKWATPNFIMDTACSLRNVAEDSTSDAKPLLPTNRRSNPSDSWFLSLTESIRIEETASSECNSQSSRDISHRSLSTFSGVFSPVALSMFSTLLFLRIGFVVGQSGVWESIIQLILAYFILIMTILSICAVSTNGKVEGGGAYFMISRTLGPEFGGAIGLLFYLANIFACGLYVSGFVEGLVDNFGPGGTFVKDGEGIQQAGRWWVYLYCSGVLAFCLIVCLTGGALFARLSALILVIVTASFLSIPISMFLKKELCIPFPNSNNLSHPHTNETNGTFPTACGNYTGFRASTFRNNMNAAYTIDYLTGKSMNFASVFAVLFSSVTGIMNGANMSGELKKPNKAIPRGTLAAVAFTFTIYLLLELLVAGTTTRPLLVNNYVFLQSINKCPPLILAGIFATTLSAALGNLIGASRILEAVAKDEIFWKLLRPATKTLCKGNPIIAVFVSWILVQLILLIGSLNAIAPITSVFFLLSYAAVNLACLGLSVASPPNFRPTFRYFSWHTSSLGLAGCLVMCFLVNPVFSGVGVSCMLLTFVALHLRAFPTSWGSFSQALIFHQVRKYMLMLDTRKEHVRFWRPHVLLLANNARSSLGSIFLCNDLKKSGLYVIGNVVVSKDHNTDEDKVSSLLRRWLDVVNEFKIKAFVEVTNAFTLREGAHQLVRLSGMGAIKPNIICLGFWDESSPEEHNPDNFRRKTFFSSSRQGSSLEKFDSIRDSSERTVEIDEWVQLIADIIDMRKNVCVLRYTNKLSYREKEGFIDVWPVNFFDQNTHDYIDITSQLMLQLSCVVHMRDDWKKFKLRFFLCADQMDESIIARKEKKFVNMLKELRIPAVVQLVRWQNVSSLPLGTYGNELIKEHCDSARLIFLYLPHPTENYKLYRKQLDLLTKDLPPVILVHGVRSVVTTSL
ncbi:DgyrCDS7174 [Dimorphilus gyrociliatus]|uniref:Solute carrier family 12 member 9 n=1 Tax=Dimorphilus gyrociliatus TaxID=2664684 RepID=A0A7I8VSI9_9ANNE|nr:DgyrCDS7174 [Dimorphilus gyrociliatus]